MLLLSDSDLWLALFEFEIKVLWLVLADALAALSLRLVLCSLLVLSNSLVTWLADADALAALSLSDFSVLSDRIRDSLTTLLVLAIFESAMDVLKLALCSLLVLADSLAALLADADVLAALSLRLVLCSLLALARVDADAL